MPAKLLIACLLAALTLVFAFPILTKASPRTTPPPISTPSPSATTTLAPITSQQTPPPPYQTGDTYALPILMFHHIADPASAPENTKNNYYPLEQLDTLLAYLANHHITTITERDLVAGAVPTKSIILSFDDGYIDTYAASLLLTRYGATGTFYIITKMLDTAGYLTTPQVADMAARGMEIGSHSVTHPNLTTLADANLSAELTQSKHALETITGTPITAFCYPTGAYDARVIQAVKDAGYTTARTTHRSFTISKNALYELPTIRMLPTTGPKSFATWW